MLPRSRILPSRIHHGAMGERHYFQVEAQSEPISETEATNPQDNHSKCFDDDGRLQRTGTFWTATSHIITAVTLPGIISISWAIGQFGWVVGPGIVVLFAFVNLFTSNLLARCYRFGDAVTGQRNYTYMDAVKANLGGRNVTVCGLIQYLNLFGVAIVYTIAASYNMTGLSCFISLGENLCINKSHITCMITFGIIEALLSQIPDLDKVWWLSIVAAIMSFIYYTVALGLGIGKVAENRFSIQGTLAGGSALTYPRILNLWNRLQALGTVAFAYSFSIILIEIQDTTKSPPAEYKTMKKAIWLSITVITVLYLLCGCVAYAAFGDSGFSTPNLIPDFVYNPHWQVNMAYIASAVHLVGAYQVYCQPIYAFVEKWSKQKWSNNNFVTAEYDVPIPIYGGIYQLNFFRLVWRTLFVMLTTFMALLMPFFINFIGILGAFGFWPLSVYFPIQMHIAQKKIGRWTAQWVALQTFSVTCLFVSIASAVGSFAQAFMNSEMYEPFETMY